MTRTRFWPEHGIAIAGRVYLYYLGIEHFAPGGTWGFRNVGTGLAILDAQAGEAQRLRWNGDWRLWPASRDDRHGGVQVVQDGDHVYVFSAVRQQYDVHAYLARVEAASIAEPAAYEYLASAAPTWDNDQSRSCTLGRCGNEFSVSFNPPSGHLMCFVDAGRTL